MTNLDIIDDIMVIYLNSSNEHNKIFSTNQTAVKVNCKLKAHCYTARRPSQPSWARARVSSLSPTVLPSPSISTAVNHVTNNKY
jgi:hypothetical protein